MCTLQSAVQARLYPKLLAALKPGATLGLSHGFLLGVMKNDSVDFRPDINVVLMAPKGMGPSVRRLYEQGKSVNGAGINCSFAIHQARRPPLPVSAHVPCPRQRPRPHCGTTHSAAAASATVLPDGLHTARLARCVQPRVPRAVAAARPRAAARAPGGIQAVFCTACAACCVLRGCV